jgi:benzylsuccinate CoA-transferase BbsE subunit
VRGANADQSANVPSQPGNLDGYRILDLTGEPGFLAGKLLGDLGADVIKIEPPHGDPARRRGPFVGGAADPERSILWLALNTSKRGITLNLDDSRGRDILLSLCRTADAVIESAGPAGAESLTVRGLGYQTLQGANEQLVVCSISPFGRDGPYSTYRGSDITAVATGGNMYPTGNPDRAPVRCALPAAYYHGGIEAAVGVVFALWGRELRGVGQFVDVSLQESVVMANMSSPSQYPLTGSKGSRTGGSFRGGRALFRELWPCADGYVSFALRGGPARIPGIIALVQYMDEHGMAPPSLKQRDWSKYNHNLIAQDEVDELEAAIGAFFRTQIMSHLFAAACERNLMLAPANTAREVLASRQLQAREFFVDLEHPELGVTLPFPGACARNSSGGAGIRRRAPRLGEHNAEVYGVLGIGAAARTALERAGVI